MTIKEVHVFDFDATLFMSPLHPTDWEGHIGSWYDTLQSLTPPCVVDPGSMWIGSTVAAAHESIANPEVYSILMTGRSAKPELAARIGELVDSAGLSFDEMHLKTGGGTQDWKSSMLIEFVQAFPELEVVQIWDDREPHLKHFVNIIEEMGLKAVPHFVNQMLDTPCDVSGVEIIENLLREYVREMLVESVEFRQVDSPLGYARSSNVKRIALCDSSVTEPADKNDSYFAEIEKWRNYTKGGKRLKKPKLDEIIPGVSDVCIIGFLDYHEEARLESGTTFWYIDYMKTRGDMRGQGSATQLVEKFYETIPHPGDYVNFGKMMQPQVGHLKDKMAEQYPEIKTKGAKYF